MQPSSLTAHLREATPHDIRALAETFIVSVNFSVPGRKLGDEFYDLERDLAPGEPGVSEPGKLWTRLQEQFQREHIWVAEIDGKIAGYIAWYDPELNEEGEYRPGEITYLFVHPSFHGHGVGTLLLNHTKQHVTDLEPLDSNVIMNLRCFEKNEKGVRFYARGGFVWKGMKEYHERTQEHLQILVWEK